MSHEEAAKPISLGLVMMHPRPDPNAVTINRLATDELFGQMQHDQEQMKEQPEKV